MTSCFKNITKLLTAMNDAVDIIKICQPLENRKSYLANDVNVDGPNLLVYAVEGAFVHEFHTDTDVGVRNEGAPKGDDVL